MGEGYQGTLAVGKMLENTEVGGRDLRRQETKGKKMLWGQ